MGQKIFIGSEGLLLDVDNIVSIKMGPADASIDIEYVVNGQVISKKLDYRDTFIGRRVKNQILNAAKPVYINEEEE